MLVRAGVDLSQLSPRRTKKELSSTCIRALNVELERQGAFDFTDRWIERPRSSCSQAVWDVLRARGWVWNPRRLHRSMDLLSGWYRESGFGMKTVDTEAYEGKFVNAPGVALYPQWTRKITGNLDDNAALYVSCTDPIQPDQASDLRAEQAVGADDRLAEEDIQVVEEDNHTIEAHEVDDHIREVESNGIVATSFSILDKSDAGDDLAQVIADAERTMEDMARATEQMQDEAEAMTRTLEDIARTVEDMDHVFDDLGPSRNYSRVELLQEGWVIL